MPATFSTTYDYRIHYKESAAIWKLSTFFSEHIPFDCEQLIFCCIGTDRSTGDSLGPLTGSRLSESVTFPHSVIGTLEKPLHALNLAKQMEGIQNNFSEPFIVAIDACLGKGDSIGQLLFQDGPLEPGSAVGKNLPSIGNVSIKGIVNVAGFMEQAVLQSTRLHLPFEMSKVIAQSLQLAHRRSTTLSYKQSSR